MGSDDWLDKLLREKQDRKQAQEDERRLESARKAKLEALIDSYWTTVKAAISDMVKKYNQKIQGRGNELYIPHARLDMLVQEKRSRSEEHTSELQSRRDLVCRLLLEKKKKEV